MYDSPEMKSKVGTTSCGGVIVEYVCDEKYRPQFTMLCELLSLNQYYWSSLDNIRENYQHDLDNNLGI